MNYHLIEIEIMNRSKKESVYISTILEQYCMENEYNIVDLYKNFSSGFKKRIRDEYIERRLVKDNKKGNNLL